MPSPPYVGFPWLALPLLLSSTPPTRHHQLPTCSPPLPASRPTRRTSHVAASRLLLLHALLPASPPTFTPWLLLLLVTLSSFLFLLERVGGGGRAGVVELPLCVRASCVRCEWVVLCVCALIHGWLHPSPTLTLCVCVCTAVCLVLEQRCMPPFSFLFFPLYVLVCLIEPILVCGVPSILDPPLFPHSRVFVFASPPFPALTLSSLSLVLSLPLSFSVCVMCVAECVRLLCCL